MKSTTSPSWPGAPLATGPARVEESDRPGLEEALDEEGFTLFVLDGSQIHDKASFHAQASNDLPLSRAPRRPNWDAFVDLLREGLTERPERQVAILWTQAAQMRRSAPAEFETALRVLEQVGSTIRTTEYGVAHPVCLRVFWVDRKEYR